MGFRIQSTAEERERKNSKSKTKMACNRGSPPTQVPLRFFGHLGRRVSGEGRRSLDPSKGGAFPAWQPLCGRFWFWVRLFLGDLFRGPGVIPTLIIRLLAAGFKPFVFVGLGLWTLGGGGFVGTRHVCKTRTKENEPYRSTVLYVRLGREQKKVEEGRGVDKDVKVHN